MSRTVFNLVLLTATIAATGCSNEPTPPNSAKLDESNVGMRDAVTSEKPIDEASHQQTADDKPDPTGTWKWKSSQNKEATMTLKLDGDKLTGSFSGSSFLGLPIEDGVFKDGEISFSMTLMIGSDKLVIKYTGKVSGDTIKGKIFDKGVQRAEWEARRWKH